jgi:hypothetical protein
MTKISTGLAATFVIIAAALQSVASAEDNKSTPAAKAAPTARPAPAARPAVPASRPAPVARPAVPQRQAPAARQVPVTPHAPATAVAPSAPARVVAPRNISPTVSPSVAAPRSRDPNVTGSAGSAARAMSLMSIRGASRATIGGQNFSIRRGSYRVNRGGHWRTFVGLGALSAITVGAAYYYPYAYIDAPYDYCQGWTEDGCQLQWQAVQTLEGPDEFQCVAYCPWR